MAIKTKKELSNEIDEVVAHALVSVVAGHDALKNPAIMIALEKTKVEMLIDIRDSLINVVDQLKEWNNEGALAITRQ